MNEIVSIVNNLIELLEQSQRVKEIFSISDKDKEDYKRVLSSQDFSYETFNELYKILTSIINFESIEIIKSDRREQNLNVIIDKSRYLAHKLSLFKSNNRKSYIFELSSFWDSWKLIYLKCLMLLFFCSSSFEYDYSENNIEIAKKHSHGDIYYRGHSNSSFKIVPSMIRSLGKTQIIDINAIERMYEKSGLLEKYKTHIDTLATVDYNFCSFIQHATSYSPLIDFTKSKDIALSFATYPHGNLNDYNNTDASIIMLSIKNIEKDINIRNINLDYHASKLKIDSMIYNKPLYECSLDDFDATFGLSTIVTNDRMRYQKGVFFCFYRCIIVKGIPLIPWSKGYLINFTIKCNDNIKLNIKSKRTIYNEIIKVHPEYDISHLMNPYEYFGEYNTILKGEK